MRRRLFLLAVTIGDSAQIHPRPGARRTLVDALADLTVANNGVANHEPEFLSKSTSPFRIAQSIKQGQKLSNVQVAERAVRTWDGPEVFGPVTLRNERVGSPG